MDFFRKMVSGDKRRYVTDKFNLDLTYITDRVIAMAFPATGVEAAYRNDGNQVASLMKENHPGHYLIYNLTERKYDTTAFEGRVRDCGWFDHHAPPLGQLFEIVEDIHKFLLEDRDNVVAIHCLAGKGRTGTVIVSYLLYSGLFHDPEEAALYFALRRSNNNWGVTGPSQQRYIRYFWEILRNRRAPNLTTPLHLVSLTMSAPPKFTVGTKRSFTPIIAAVDVSGGLVQQSIWISRGDRTFTDDNEKIVFNLTSGPDAPSQPILLLGDINFTIDTWGAFGRKTKFARFAFNTGMIVNDHEGQFSLVNSEDGRMKTIEHQPIAQNDEQVGRDIQQVNSSSDSRGQTIVIRFPKFELDDACSDKRAPDGFYVELVFKRVWTRDWIENTSFLTRTDVSFWEKLFSEYRDTNGVACFKPRPDMSLVQIIAKARALTDSRSGEPPKMGGWLTKRGHRIKNWKRRWFALHADTLEYSKSPKSTNPAGVIKLDDIIAVQQADPSESEFPNSFIIYTNWNDFLCYAQNEMDMEEWVNTLNLTLQLKEQKKELSEATVGQISLTVLELKNVPCDDYYTVTTLGSQISKTSTTKSFGKEVVFDVFHHSSDSMVIQLWEENTYLPDAILGEIHIVLDMFRNENLTNPLELVEWYSFRHQVTRIKLKIIYRPKAWIEAQRIPNTNPVSPSVSTSASPVHTRGKVFHSKTLGSSRSGAGPIQLSNSPSQNSISPSRSLLSSSKTISTAELKELIDILDQGISEALQSPDMDRMDFEQSWDWSFTPITAAAIHQQSIPRELRYSSTVHTIDEDLPIYMRPISLDLGLPPSTSSSSLSTAAAKPNQTESPKSNAVPHQETHLNFPQNRDVVSESPSSPKPYDASNIKREIAVRAPINIPASAAVKETSSTIETDSDANVITAVQRAVSPPQSRQPTNSSSSANASVELSTAKEWSAALPGTKSPTGPLSPRGHKGASLSVSGAMNHTEPTIGNARQQDPHSPHPTRPAASSLSWVNPAAPSESVLQTYMEQSSTTKAKVIQQQGNTARERRRNRRPTFDSQHPPQFQDYQTFLPVIEQQEQLQKLQRLHAEAEVKDDQEETEI